MGRRNRVLGLKPLGPGHGHQVHRGLIDTLADPAVLRRPAAFPGDALLMGLVIEVGSIVGDDDHGGKFHVGRRPQRRDAHQVIAGAQHADGQPAAVLPG